MSAKKIPTIVGTVAQYPAGATVHEVYGGASSPATTLLHTFAAETTEGDVLTHAFTSPPTIRYPDDDRLLKSAFPRDWREEAARLAHESSAYGFDQFASAAATLVDLCAAIRGRDTIRPSPFWICA